jgi:hypothetical protein
MAEPAKLSGVGYYAKHLDAVLKALVPPLRQNPDYERESAVFKRKRLWPANENENKELQLERIEELRELVESSKSPTLREFFDSFTWERCQHNAFNPSNMLQAFEAFYSLDHASGSTPTMRDVNHYTIQRNSHRRNSHRRRRRTPLDSAEPAEVVPTESAPTAETVQEDTTYQVLGERLHPLVLAKTGSVLADKITGMLLELETSVVENLIASEEELETYIDHAKDTLHQALGEQLYTRVLDITGLATAGKITGMLLELSPSEVKDLIESDANLRTRVDEAQRLLAPPTPVVVFCSLLDAPAPVVASVVAPGAYTAAELLSTMIEESEMPEDRWRLLRVQLNRHRWHGVDHPLVRILPFQKRNAETIKEMLETTRNIRFLYNYHIALDRFLSDTEERTLGDILDEAYRISTLPESNITKKDDHESKLNNLGRARGVLGILSTPHLEDGGRGGHIGKFRFADIALRRILSACVRADNKLRLSPTLRDAIIDITRETVGVLPNLNSIIDKWIPNLNTPCPTTSHPTTPRPTTPSIDAIAELMKYKNWAYSDPEECWKSLTARGLAGIVLHKAHLFTDMAQTLGCAPHRILWMNIICYAKDAVNDRIKPVLPLIFDPHEEVFDESGWTDSGGRGGRGGSGGSGNWRAYKR